MDRDYNFSLAGIRLSRAKELLKDAKDLLKNGSFKSANNRAFYAMEKAVRALLILENAEPQTHNGILKQFNYLFIYRGSGFFTQEDYQKLANSDKIRNGAFILDFLLAGND